MDRGKGRGAVDALRRMDWLTARRARAYRIILVVVALGVAAATLLTARGGVDLGGKPLGTDFLAFWSASRLALAGDFGAPYRLARIYAVERAAFAVDPGSSSFLYPPPFLLLCLPLGLAPYLVALAGWLMATGTAYVLVIRRWLTRRPETARAAALTVLAFPAVLVNAGHGQNGFLTAALLGGGLWLIDRRPWLAGMLLGLLVIKPQVAFAVPILVLASGRWRVAAAGVLTALAACLASWLVLGPAAWTGFFAGSATGRAILEQGLVDPGKMVSSFAAARVIGASWAAAYAVQAAVALATVVVLALVVWHRRGGRGPERADAACCAAAGVLMSPFLLDYDLTATAIPLAWLLGEGIRRGFLPWERAVLVAAFLLPLVGRWLAIGLGVPVAPLVLFALFAACVRAARLPQSQPAPRPLS